LQYKANEKPIKKLKVDLTVIEGNQLDEVFYIESLQIFYIGEWAIIILSIHMFPYGIDWLY
jgi:hypothetical protein